MMRRIVRVDADGCIVEPGECGDPYVRCLTGEGWVWHRVYHVGPEARRARCLECEKRRDAERKAAIRRVVRRAMGDAAGGA